VKFFKYWVQASENVDSGGSAWKVQRYGSSNVSAADALTNAEELASNTAAVFRAGDFPDNYLYSDRPVREEIIMEQEETEVTKSDGSNFLNNRSLFPQKARDNLEANSRQASSGARKTVPEEFH
jgi:hypothetical protein